MSYDLPQELPEDQLSLIRFLIEDHAFSTEFLVTTVQEYYQNNAKEKNTQPHQERVVSEKAELDDKLFKLSQFIDGSSTFKSLPVAERERLMKQRYVMGSYSKILGDRIAAF